MAHSHHNHSHNHSDTASKNISVAFFLNAFFVVIELIGGLLTNSISILSDALHDFGDCLSLGVAWFVQKKSQKGSDANYSYGYKRFSLLGAVFLSGILTISSLFVMYEAVQRVFEPQNVEAVGMMWIAVFGLIINGAAALRMKRGTSLNERSVYLHIMEDVLGWVGVLVVSICMRFWDLPILDPILSLVISIWVLYNVVGNLKATFRVLLQHVPEDISTDKLTADILKINGVESIHDLHLWTLDGESHVMTLHVVTSSDTVVDSVKQSIIDLSKNYHISHCTIEIENASTKVCSLIQ